MQITKFELALWPKKNKIEGVITEGVLVVKYEGETGVVCSDNWDLKESRVACGELGFTDSVPTTTRPTLDQLRRIYSYVFVRYQDVPLGIHTLSKYNHRHPHAIKI